MEADLKELLQAPAPRVVFGDFNAVANATDTTGDPSWLLSKQLAEWVHAGRLADACDLTGTPKAYTRRHANGTAARLDRIYANPAAAALFPPGTVEAVPTLSEHQSVIFRYRDPNPKTQLPERTRWWRKADVKAWVNIVKAHAPTPAPANISTAEAWDRVEDLQRAMLEAKETVSGMQEGHGATAAQQACSRRTSTLSSAALL